MAKKIDNPQAALLQFVFEFPATELESVAGQMDDEIGQALTAALSTLTAREERVMRCLHGIGCEPMTMAAISREFSEQLGRAVPSGRVRQIRDTAQRKLCHPSRINPLTRKLLAAGVSFTGLGELREEQSMPIEQRSIKALGLPIRVEQALHKAAVEQVSDLLDKDADDIRRIEGISHKGLRNIREALDAHRLRLKASY